LGLATFTAPFAALPPLPFAAAFAPLPRCDLAPLTPQFPLPQHPRDHLVLRRDPRLGIHAEQDQVRSPHRLRNLFLNVIRQGPQIDPDLVDLLPLGRVHAVPARIDHLDRLDRAPSIR
jgi:hypothetical protein